MERRFKESQLDRAAIRFMQGGIAGGRPDLWAACALSSSCARFELSRFDEDEMGSMRTPSSGRGCTAYGSELIPAAGEMAASWGESPEILGISPPSIASQNPRAGCDEEGYDGG